MKKLFYSLLMLTMLSLTFSACKKDKKNDEDNGTLNKSWKVGDKTYKQGFSMFIPQGVATTLAAFTTIPSGDATVDNLQVIFKTKPTANGTYKIVYKPTYSELNADEVYVSAAEANGDKAAVAKGDDNKTATVAVSGGKVSVTIPKVSAYYGPHNGSLNETTTIEGNIVEQ